MDRMTRDTGDLERAIQARQEELATYAALHQERWGTRPNMAKVLAADVDLKHLRNELRTVHCEPAMTTCALCDTQWCDVHDGDGSMVCPDFGRLCAGCAEGHTANCVTCSREARDDYLQDQADAIRKGEW